MRLINHVFKAHAYIYNSWLDVNCNCTNRKSHGYDKDKINKHTVKNKKCTRDSLNCHLFVKNCLLIQSKTWL